MNSKMITDWAKQTASEASEHNVPRMAAALAYYTTFSLAPLLIIVIAIVALVLGQKGATEGISQQIQGFVGQTAADAIQSMIKSANKPSQGILSTLIGFVTLLIGASGVFGELQSSLNTVWNAKPKSTSGIKGFLCTRFWSFAMVLATGFVLLVSLIASAVITTASTALGNMLPFSESIAHLVSVVLSLILTSAMFAAIFKYMPDVQIEWKHVWVGALFTAILFTIGKNLIGWYLGSSAVTSTYGAAGSVIVVLLWVYYSSILLLVGAEFTHIYHQWETTRPQREAERIRDQVPHTASGYAKAPPL